MKKSESAKRILGGFVVGLLVGIAGMFVCQADISLFPQPYGLSSPNIEDHLRLIDEKPPQFSSRHFFFCSRWLDPDEYWYFEPPPEQAREFIDTLWFSDNVELSEVYAKPGSFCGYADDKNRIYLMKWCE